MSNDIILIIVLVLFFLYWFDSQKIKEIALNAVRDRCLLNEVQLIDSYVALNSFRLKRDDSGKICITRSFSFEFTSTGNERYNGTVVMSGSRVQSIYMQPYRIQ